MMRRYWWHCTEEHKGWTFTSKLLAPPFRGTAEPATPRLCVAPSVASCFAARLFHRQVYCYRTVKPCKAVAPKATWDCPITGEGWIVHPVQMELLTTVPEDVSQYICKSTREYLLKNKKGMTPWMVILLYFRAIQVLKKLGPQFSQAWEYNLMQDYIKMIKDTASKANDEISGKELIDAIERLRNEVGM